ncbi:MAG: phosphoglucomutase/phosphomannomutase family protein, partial [Nitrospiria bacterium]
MSRPKPAHPSLTFGTSGWRAVIADQFTFGHVRLVTRAIADYLADQGLAGRPVVVGYDTRFLSDRFARDAAAVLAGRGWRVLLATRDTPTPVVSHAILHARAAGGVNITASHNPPEYNGIKFSPSWAGPALPETTGWIERRIVELQRKPPDEGGSERAGSIEPLDPREAYLTHLGTVVDGAVIQSAKLRVVVDVLYGTARGYLDACLTAEGCDVILLHGEPDPLFGGGAPDPSERRLTEMAAL